VPFACSLARLVRHFRGYFLSLTTGRIFGEHLTTSGLPQDFSDQLRANVSEDERTFLVDSQTIYDHYRRAFSLTKVLGT